MSQTFDAAAHKQATDKKGPAARPHASALLMDEVEPDHLADDLPQDDIMLPGAVNDGPVGGNGQQAAAVPERPRHRRRNAMTEDQLAPDARGARLGMLGLPKKEGRDAPMILGSRQMGEGNTLHTAVGEGEGDSIVLGTPTTIAEVAQMGPEDIAKFPGNPDTAMPCGPQARPIMMKAFGANWFYAKDVLLRGQWPDALKGSQAPLVKSKDNAELLMWKLLALRSFEYDGILHNLRERYLTREAERPKDLNTVLEWGSAGSVTITSDIDVNLGGKYNMEAVKDFNSEFAKRGWPFEAGTVFDVNVYCKDNMHGFGFQKMSEQKDALKKGQPLGTQVMTVNQESDMTKDVANYEQDQANQEVAAMVKLIRFMTQSGDWRGHLKWGQYKAALKCDDATPLAQRPAETYLKVREAQIRYDVWRDELATMKAQLVRAGSAATDTLALVAADHGKKTADALDMQASNRLYELKIERLKLLRARLAVLAADKTTDNTLAILDTSIELRDTILQAGMFANEAMITAGASNFVVFGTQTGIKAKTIAKAGEKTGEKTDALKIKLTEAQLYHAFTEQLADTIKEFHHFERLDEGLFKGGKYLMRMTLAADQLSGVDPSKIKHYNKLRKLGDFAMTAKGMDGTMTAINQVMEKAIKQQIGISDMTDRHAFEDIVMEFATGVVSAYQAAKAKVPVPVMPEPSDPDMMEKMSAYQAARAEKTGAQLRLASLKGEDLTKEIEKMSAGAVHAKRQ